MAYEKSSATVLKRIEGASDEKLFDRYLEPADKDYDPTDKEFALDISDTLYERDPKNNNKLKYRAFLSVCDTPCFDELLKMLYVKVLPFALAKGFKLNLSAIINDIDAMMGAEDNSEWLRKCANSTKKTFKMPEEFKKILSDVCLDNVTRSLNVIGKTF